MMLLETLEGSDRLAEYAKRTEVIKVYDIGTLEVGLLKRLSEFCPNVHQLCVKDFTILNIHFFEISKLPSQLSHRVYLQLILSTF